MIRVEQRGQLRVLTIDGVVQGAASEQSEAAATAGDPLVQLARLVRPDARSALVIGLGTGATASELARTGIEVEVAELEPVVAEYARRYFGYGGHVAIADGLEYARSSRRSFDLVILDAFDGRQTPSQLVDRGALRSYRDRRGADGVTVIRMLASPTAASTMGLWQTLGDRFRLAFGSGVGDEPQNLVMLGSGAPMTLLDGTSLSMWPVVPGEREATTLSWPAAERTPERDVTVMGYLVRDESGALFVDLPHYEMGGVRYALDDASASQVKGLLPVGARYPTQGDIRSDGEVGGTLREVAGGGGVKRSDVRFSPVVVEVKGRARLRALIDPDAWMGPPRKGPGAPWNALLPYGGVLYEIHGASVTWSLQWSDWTRVRGRQLAPIASRASVALAQGRLSEASDELDKYVRAAVKALGAPVARVAALQAVALLQRRLAEHVAKLGAAPTSFAVAAACDRIQSLQQQDDDGVAVDANRVREALGKCALRLYERSAMSNEADARVSAGRLMLLIDGTDPSRAGLIRALEKRHGELEPVSEPPGDATQP